MRRPSVPAALLALAIALLVAGVLLYDAGSHRLGGALLAAAVLGGILFVTPGPSSEHRSPH